MAVSFKAAEIEQLAVSPGGTLYTCPANTTAQVIFAVANNVDTTNSTTFTVQVTPSGGSAAEYISGRVVASGKSDPCPEIVGLVLDAGDAVVAYAGAASDINLKIGVKEIT